MKQPHISTVSVATTSVAIAAKLCHNHVEGLQSYQG